jgi:hypothetical protein
MRIRNISAKTAEVDILVSLVHECGAEENFVLAPGGSIRRRRRLSSTGKLVFCNSVTAKKISRSDLP